MEGLRLAVNFYLFRVFAATENNTNEVQLLISYVFSVVSRRT